MNQEFIVIDGRTLPPAVVREKRRKELRHEISIYRKNLEKSQRWLLLNGWIASETKTAQVRGHINHLRATIAEKTEELNRLCTH